MSGFRFRCVECAVTYSESPARLEPIGHFAAEPVPRAFAVDPGGRCLLSAGLASGRLACYRIDPQSGALERSATYDVGTEPMWVTIV